MRPGLPLSRITIFAHLAAEVLGSSVAMFVSGQYLQANHFAAADHRPRGKPPSIVRRNATHKPFAYRTTFHFSVTMTSTDF
jgi:hypothetical protein